MVAKKQFLNRIGKDPRRREKYARMKLSRLRNLARRKNTIKSNYDLSSARDQVLMMETVFQKHGLLTKTHPLGDYKRWTLAEDELRITVKNSMLAGFEDVKLLSEVFMPNGRQIVHRVTDLKDLCQKYNQNPEKVLQVIQSRFDSANSANRILRDEIHKVQTQDLDEKKLLILRNTVDAIGQLIGPYQYASLMLPML